MRISLLFMAAVFATNVNAQLSGPAPFKKGDRIVFAGNSITEAGFYSLYIWQYYQLHFPDQRITIMNGGVGGDVAGQIFDRFDLDILRLKPNKVVVTFGMNDSRYFEYFNKPQAEVRKEAVATSLASFQKLEKKLLALPDISPIIMTSSPFDETRGGSNNKFTGKSKTLLSIAEFQEAAARKNKWAYVDLLRPMTIIDEREQKKDSMFTLTGPDRIHPGNAGHMAMAWIFLKAQGLAGKPVADIQIDVKKGKLTKAENCELSNLKTGSDNISFDYMAGSLPFPADSSSRVWENPQKQYEVLKVIPFTKEMNSELLTVKGLKPQQIYELRIDGIAIGSWLGSEWAKGINLAEQTETPQYKQAKQVAELNLQYREVEQKLRAYYWLQFNYFRKKNMLYQDDQAALDSAMQANDWAVASKRENYKEGRKKEVRAQWEQMLLDIENRIYQSNKPLLRRLEIVRKK